MFPEPRYLQWARCFYGQVPYDLASSGMAPLTHADVGALPPLDDPAGPDRLRRAIARYNDVAESNVVAALGTTHALFLAFGSLLAPGDEALVEQPTYEPLWAIAQGAGATVRGFERAAEEKFRLDPARVSAQVTDRTKVIALSNLHNPSGVRADDESLRAIAALMASRGGHLVVDEVYAPFDELTTDDGTWTKTARKIAPNVVVTASLTKCFGAGRQRLGWVLADAAVSARVEQTRLSTCGDLPLEHANLGVHLFRVLPALAQRARERIAGKRPVVEAWLSTHPTLAWSAPTSGLFGFVSCPGVTDLRSRIEAAAARDGVLVAPGEFFGTPGGFRLSWSIDCSRLAEGLRRLEAVVA